MGASGSCSCDSPSCIAGKTGSASEVPIHVSVSRKEKEEEVMTLSSMKKNSRQQDGYPTALGSLEHENTETTNVPDSVPAAVSAMEALNADANGAEATDTPRYEELPEEETADDIVGSTSGEDEVDAEDLETYATTLAERLSRGHTLVVKAVVRFLQKHRDLAVGKDRSSEFHPFICRIHNDCGLDEVERIVVDLTIWRKEQTFRVKTKSFCSTLECGEAREALAEQALRPRSDDDVAFLEDTTTQEPAPADLPGFREETVEAREEAEQESERPIEPPPPIEVSEQINPRLSRAEENGHIKQLSLNSNKETQDRCCFPCCKKPDPREKGGRCARGSIAPISLGKGDQQVSLESYLHDLEARKLASDGHVGTNVGFAV